MQTFRALGRSSLVALMAVGCASAPQASTVQGSRPAEVVELAPLPAQPSGSSRASDASNSNPTPFTAQSLEDYLRVRFGPLVSGGLLELGYPMETSRDELMEELKCFRLTSTADIAALVPPDFDRRGVAVLAKLPAPAANTLSLLRDFMIIKDAEHYFTHCWGSHFIAGPHEFPLPNAYGVGEQTLTRLLSTGDAALAP